MPPRKVAGNPEYIEILEAQREKIVSKDPTNNLQYAYGKAIKYLKDCPDRQAYPGEIKVKYVGPTILAFLKTELAKRHHQRPVEGYDSLVSSSGSSSDPASAADSISPQPRLTAKQKGKGRASGLDLNLDAGLHAIAGKFGNPSVRQPPNDKPFKQPSANALGKAAALEESILVGLYTQCTETSQKIWKSEKELLMLAEPWMTVQTKILAPRLTALTARKHLEVHVRGTDLPVYSFTWEGYKIAETAASGKGLQPVAIVQNDLILPERPVVQQSMTSVNGRSPTSTIRDALESGLSNNAASECGVTAARPKSIVSVPRNAPIAGQFATVIPRKRAAEETYQGLSQYTRAAADESADATASVHTAHRPINKRFAAPSIASVFQDKPTAAPAAHSNVLPFQFTYVDENDNRVSTAEEADVKLAEDGTPMHKVEYRTRQARHLLAKLVHDKMPMERTPCDPEGPTECGWMAASKAPQRCPGLAPLKAPPSRNTENGEVRIKKASKSSTIADLMSGVQKQKKTDSRAMYKFPSIDAYDFDKSSSPEKSKIVPESNASTATKTNKTMPLTAAQGVTQSNSTANLIKTIFGQTPACSDPGPSKISQDPTSKPQTHLFSKPRAEEAGNVQGVSSMSTTSRAAISTPSTVTSPPASQSYSKSYSWALEDHVTFPSFDPVLLDPNTYHVVMQIDHREHNCVPKGTLESFFTKKGINFQTTNLVLGDYVWLARRKIFKGDGYDEVVLALCERKRKDDFLESIKTERHKNQKRRIKAAGVRRCFYLVEESDIGNDDRAEVFTKAIQTSINQTLLIDGFSLHIADSHVETMAHLVRMTRALEEEAKTSAVRVIPDACVKREEIAAHQRYLERQEPQSLYCTSLRVFNDIGRVHTTTQSQWAKQIRHVCGVSEEKCVQFLDEYPTPASFFEDLDNRQAREAESATSLGHKDSSDKKSRKLKPSDPRLHVKIKIETTADHPRPMCESTSARLWHLATAASYTGY